MRIFYRQLAIIPDSLARDLGISADRLEGDGLEVTIGTSTFWVIGIIDADKLNRLQGLDGKSILPVDLNALQALGTTRSAGSAEQVAIPEDAARIDAARVLILTRAPDGVDGQGKDMQGLGDLGLRRRRWRRGFRGNVKAGCQRWWSQRWN